MKFVKEYSTTLLLLIGIIILGTLLGSKFARTYNLNTLFSVITATLMIIKFKSLAKFIDNQTSNIPSILPKRWHIFFVQGVILLMGFWILITNLFNFSI